MRRITVTGPNSKKSVTLLVDCIFSELQFFQIEKIVTAFCKKNHMATHCPCIKKDDIGIHSGVDRLSWSWVVHFSKKMRYSTILLNGYASKTELDAERILKNVRE